MSELRKKPWVGRGFLPEPANALILLLALTVPAGAHDIRGKVQTPGGTAVAGATVSIPELALLARSGENGAFLLEGVPEGRYVLTVEGPGLVPTRIPVVVPLAAPLEVPVMTVASLKEGGESGAESGSQAQVETAGVAAGDAGAVKVQLLCTNCNAASLSLLGLDQHHLDLRLDGVPIFEGIEAVWALSMLPAEAVEKSVVVPGPGSVFSGADGLAGSMDIETRDPFSGPAFHGGLTRGSFDLWSAEIYARGRITENLAADVVATHSDTDPVNPNGDARNEQGALDRETLTTRFTYRFNDRDRLRIGVHLYDEDQWRGPGSVIRYRIGDQVVQNWLDETVPIRRRALNARWEHEFENGAYIRAVGLHSDRSQRITERVVADTFAPLFDVDADYEYGEVVAGRTLGNRLLLEGGAEYEKEVLNVHDHYRAGSESEFVRDVVESRSGFVQGTLSLPARVDLVLGVRHDDFGRFGDAWSPRMGLRWKPRHGVYVSLGLGKSFQPPRPVFEEVCCGNRYQSNKEVGSETGKAVHLSVGWYPNQRWKFTFGGLHAEFDDYITHVVTGSAGYNHVIRNENAPQASITGAEGGFQFRLERFSMGGSYGVVDTDLGGDILTLQPDFNHGGALVEVLVLPGSVGRLPNITERTGSFYASWVGRLWDASLNADYYGHQWIQMLDDQFGEVLPELFPTEPYWSVRVQGTRHFGPMSVVAGVDNVLDEYQNDLGDSRTSAKWGLQRGRFYYGGIKVDF